jgi:bacterial leucyl aminopeptidase
MKISKLCLAVVILFALVSIISCRKDTTPAKPEKEILTEELINEINADSILALITWFQDMGTRFALSDTRKSVALKIKNRFIRLGYTDTELDSFQISKTWRNVLYLQMQYNVIATLKGSLYPDSVSIVGGHYDDILSNGDPAIITPGANDNASGISAIIEIARVVKKKNWTPESTIKFMAFGSEEQGLLGSTDYVAKAIQKGEKIKMMLNHDMVAYETSNDKTTWIVNIIDYDNSHDLRILAQSLCRKYTVLNYINVNTYNKQSDSYPFSLYGYKALFFFSYDPDPNYHTLMDLVTYCNPGYCAEIVKVSCALLVNKD